MSPASGWPPPGRCCRSRNCRGALLCSCCCSPRSPAPPSCLSLGGMVFQPLPGLLVALLATASRGGLPGSPNSAAGGARAAAVFRGRLAPAAITRLTESDLPDLSVPQTREVTVVFCEIANQADLIDELAPADCARLTNEFIAAAQRAFSARKAAICTARMAKVSTRSSAIRWPQPNHAAAAARAALAFRDRMAVLAYQQPDSLGKIDLRIGISSGPVVATVPDAEVQRRRGDQRRADRARAPARDREQSLRLARFCSGRALSAKRARRSSRGRSISCAAAKRTSGWKFTNCSRSRRKRARRKLPAAIVSGPGWFISASGAGKRLSPSSTARAAAMSRSTSRCNGICAGSSR